MTFALRRLERSYPSGRLVEAGTVVGCWCVLPESGLDRVLRTVRREGRSLVTRRFRVEGDAARAVGAHLRGRPRAWGRSLHPLPDWSTTAAVRWLSGFGAFVDGWMVDEMVRDAIRGARPYADLSARRAAEARIAAVRADLRAFLATLDPVAVAALPSMPPDAGPLEDWTLLDVTFGADPALRDAVAAHPWLAVPIAEGWAADPTRAAVQAVHGAAGILVSWLRANVDAHPVAVARHAEAEAAVKAADGRDVTAACQIVGVWEPVDDLRKLTSVLATTRLVPGNWVPSGEGGWAGYVRCLRVIDLANQLAGGHLPRFLHAGPDWDRWHDVVADAAGTADLRAALDDAWDVARALSRHVVDPALRRAGAVEGCDVGQHPTAVGLAWKALHRGRTLRTCLALSRRWHHDPGFASFRSGAGLETGLAWPPGLPDATFGDVRLRVLTDDVQLSDEGGRQVDGDGAAGLSHCVDAYGPSCASGRSRVVSLSRATPGGGRERLSTLELRLSRRDVVAVVQHRGARNGVPGPEAAAAAEAYVAALRSGTLAVDRDGWRPVEPVTVHAPAMTDGEWAAWRDLWDPLLPAPLRGLDPDGWAAVAEANPARVGVPHWSPLGLGGGVAVRDGRPDLRAPRP